MDKLCIVFFATLVTLCAAQQPETCRDSKSTPKQWEARLFETSSRGARFAHIYYDADNNRTRIKEEVFINETRDFYDELFFHKMGKGVGYRLNLKTKECDKFELNEPFHVIGVPPEAQLEGELEIGTAAVPGGGVEVDVYDGDTPRGRYGGEWIPGDHSCLPVSDTYISRIDKGVIHWSFFDITTIGNPDAAFKLPDECE